MDGDIVVDHVIRVPEVVHKRDESRDRAPSVSELSAEFVRVRLRVDEDF